MIKLIASDLDGSLLNEKRELTDFTKEIVRRAVAQGKIFLMATGRSFTGSVRFAKEVGLDLPMLCFNGSLVKLGLTKKMLFEHKVKAETAQKVLSFAREKGYHLQYYIGDEVYCYAKNKYTELYKERIGVEVTALGEDFYKLKEAPYKLLIALEPLDQLPICKIVQEAFKDSLEVTPSSEDYLELMEPGVNKWSTLKFIAESYGIKPEEIMSFGDSGNDLTMVKYAGLGVAMGNAHENIKEAAKLIAASNEEDGVAKEVEKILALD